MITPIWSTGGELLALFWDGAAAALPTETEACQIEVRYGEPAVADGTVVRLDARALPEDAQTQIAALRQAGHPVWIDHVDSVEVLQCVQLCAPEGVQGLFWQVSNGKPSTSADHATLLRLLGLLNADAENKDIELAVSGSPHLLFGLLRLVNSVGVGGGRQRIAGIGHAITMLGRRQLQRWIMLLLYAERYDQGDLFSPLLIMTCVRARLMENLCRKIEGSIRSQSDMAFMIGMLSSLDRVLGEPMETLLSRVSLSEQGEAVLLRGEGPFAPLLNLVRAGETGEAGQVATLLDGLGLTAEDWATQSWAAWCWLDRLRREG